VIPILMTPVLNRWDLAKRMLESVDVYVETVLIIDNGMTKKPGVVTDREQVGRVVQWLPPNTGLGYGGAINFMVTQFPDCPWWLWASNDVVFHPGQLEHVARRMGEADGPRLITGGFTWGAANAAVIDRVGLVDDWSFFPIYFDDNDYHYRCTLAGIEWIEDRSGWTHGDSQHGASLTIQSDPKIRMANDRSFVQNSRAYIDKWGGPPGHETFTSPWNSGMPIWVTKPDIAGRRARQW